MDLQGTIPIQQFESPIGDKGISQNEDFLEYRDLVFQELASEYGKGSATELDSDVRIPAGYDSIVMDIQYPLSPELGEYTYPSVGYNDSSGKGDNTSDSIDELSKDSPTHPQPSWDDSDLKTELIIAPPPVQSLPVLEDDVKRNLLISSDQNSPEDEGKTGFDDSAKLTLTRTADSLKSLSSSDSVPLNSPLSSPLSPGERKRSPRNHIMKQKNDRRAILNKLISEEENDSFSYGNNKPWYNPKTERMNSQNLQICYINDSSSSDSDDNPKTGLMSQPWMPPSPAITPLSPTLQRRNILNRMTSSSSISSTSSGGYRTSTSSPPCDRGIINVRSSASVEESPQKALSKQDEMEQQVIIEIAQAHQEAKRLAEEERIRSRKKSSSSLSNLQMVPFDDVIRSKVKTRSLNRSDCRKMSISQLQIILNSMHSEKETLNAELKTILEIRDELRTEQDAKLLDVEDMKVMLAETGPETTV